MADGVFMQGTQQVPSHLKLGPFRKLNLKGTNALSFSWSGYHLFNKVLVFDFNKIYTYPLLCDAGPKLFVSCVFEAYQNKEIAQDAYGLFKLSREETKPELVLLEVLKLLGQKYWVVLAL